MNRLYVMDLPERHAAAADSAPASGTAGTGTEGEFMPTWSPDGRSIVYVTWTTTGGHIKRVPATGGAAADAHRARGLLPRSRRTRPTARASCSCAGAAADQLYSILLDTPPPDDEPTSAPREIGGVNPPNTLEIRWMPAAGGASTLVASAQGGRGPHFARNDSTRVYLTASRGLQSITIDGYDRRTHLPRHRASGPATTRRRPTRFGCRPTARARSSACRASITWSRCRRAGRETVDVRIQGRGDNAAVPVKRDVARRRRLPAVDRATARR